jgi:hypothetical protein
MKTGALLACFACGLLITACQGLGGPTTSGGGQPGRERGTPKPQKPRAPASAPARDSQLEQRLARTELRLLEKEAQVEELQARLDDARREVVRSMAKLQSLATRAEAASGIAEAEIALQALRTATGAPGAAEAGQLMKLSSAEFDKENYAGALYLANQSKAAALAARGQLTSAERAAPRPGEVPFALPLKLQTASRANLRDGPGGSFAIVTTLQAGSPLTGQAYVDEWVRVTDDNGRRGWIHQGLVSRRQ